MGTPGTDAVTLRSELPRKLVHIGMGAFALLLRWLTPWQAMLMAVAALILNSWFLPALTIKSTSTGSDVCRTVLLTDPAFSNWPIRLMNTSASQICSIQPR